MVIPVIKDAYLGHLLTNIRANTTKPEEILVIDNGNGIAGPICAQFTDLPIRYLPQQCNVGVNAAWNLGLQEAKFNIVSILNDDLIISPCFFEMVWRVFENDQRAGFVVPQTVLDPGLVGGGGAPVTCQLPSREGWAFTIRKDIVTPIPPDLFSFYGDDWFFRQVKGKDFHALKITNNRIFHYVGISRNLDERLDLKVSLEHDREVWQSVVSRVEIPAAALPTIFVSIASYRDPDCQNTVKDLFEKAAHPERIFIGICLQVDPEEDKDCYVSVSERSGQIRIIEIHAWDSQGACWARSRIQGLWQDEDYFLQVDSHMRFVAGWDERLICMLAQCPSDKPVLSTYPLGFTPPDTYAKDALVVLRPRGFDEFGILSNGSSLVAMSDAPAIPRQSYFIGAGLMFTLGKVVNEVPYDPHLYFEGEEISMAVRLWTGGWDIFTPNKVVAYHDYGNRPDRPRRWKDEKNKTNWVGRDKRSRRRICHLLGIKTASDVEDLLEIEKYGLGVVRTVAEYEALSGLDFKAHSYNGQPLPLEHLTADKPNQAAQRRIVFANIRNGNLWGNPETCSGPGSTLNSTGMLRTLLPEYFRALGVRVLVDAGCGDLNWMQGLTEHLQFYFGYDIVPGIISELQARYASRPNHFFSAADVVMDKMPECDAILCRDCLTHLPLDAAQMAIKHFRESGARYLFATTHAGGRNIWVVSGGWYAMNLQAPPFNFPAPQLVINEGGAKQLGIWAAADLPVF